MKLMVIAGLVLSISAITSYAQETLGGKYSGGYMVKTGQGEQLVTIVLEITSVESGKVKAKALRGAVGNRGPGIICAGQYQMEGTYENNNLVIKPVTVPGGSDCNLVFVLVAEGNKLKGTINKREAELSK